MKAFSIHLPLAALALCGALARSEAATIIYTNDFSGAGSNTALPNEIVDAEWTLTGGSYVNNVSNNSNTAQVASIPITNADPGVDFTIETQLTVSSYGTTVANGVQTVGFGVLGATSNFAGSAPSSSYYLADWVVTNGGGSAAPVGSLRLFALGDSSGFSASAFAIADGSPIGNRAADLDTTYTLRLEGAYSGGTLQLTLSVWDAAGTTQIGGSTTATDASPLTGDFFGYRNRYTITTGGTTTVSFDNLGVVPEPGTVTMFGLGLGIFLVRLHRRR